MVDGLVDKLVSSLGFVIIIIGGYFLKKKGFFKREDGVLISKIVMNITLPAVIISGTKNMEINFVTFGIIFLGIGCNLFTVLLSRIFHRKSSKEEKAIAMINCSGYNIGNFAIPFASGFFDPTSVTYMCIFDIGNCFMNLGGTFALAENEFLGKSSFNKKNFIKTILSSIAFDVYLVLFILTLLSINIPKEVLSLASIIGGGNSFLAMLMIGILLDLDNVKEKILKVRKILFVRYLANLILSMVIYIIVPIPKLAKIVIILILFSPISTASVVYSNKINENNEIPPLANSLSIVFGISIITVLLLVFA